MGILELVAIVVIAVWIEKSVSFYVGRVYRGIMRKRDESEADRLLAKNIQSLEDAWGGEIAYKAVKPKKAKSNVKVVAKVGKKK